MTGPIGHLRWCIVQSRAFVALNWKQEEYRQALSPLPKIIGPALVAGSAPNPERPANVDAHWFRVSVNASQLLFDKFDLPPPDLTIVRPRIKLRGPAQDAAWAVLKGRSTGHLVPLIKRPGDVGISEFIVGKDYSASAVTELGYVYKAAIVAEISGRYLISAGWAANRDISNGLFAVLLALKLGASHVVMSGFSFQTGWNYAGNARGRRGHVVADRIICRAIVERGLPVYSSDPDFAKRTGLRFWTGSKRD